MGTLGERVTAANTEAPHAPWPTLHELRAFVAVSDTLHFGQAARTLGLAPSTLSELIRRLEETVGAVLLERSSRHVALTEAGRGCCRWPATSSRASPPPAPSPHHRWGGSLRR